MRTRRSSTAPPQPPGETRVPLELRCATKVYGRGAAQVRALDEVSLGCPAHSWTAIMGPSGSGKSTLLHCAAGLERLSSGQVVLAGADITSSSERELTALRRGRVGFVFQSFNLMPALTAEQNIALPSRLAGKSLSRSAIHDSLARLGIADRADHRPRELSGGQQQRVALARALVTAPEVLFADEPTGALDMTAARSVLDLFRGLVDEQGQTVVMVTHDPAAAARADDVVFLADGRIVDRLHRPNAQQVATRLASLEG